MSDILKQEKIRLETALIRLEEVAERCIKTAHEKAASRLSAEIGTLNDKLQAAREELTHQSAELVRVKDENRKLRETNKKVAEALNDSIKEIEGMVA